MTELLEVVFKDLWRTYGEFQRISNKKVNLFWVLKGKQGFSRQAKLENIVQRNEVVYAICLCMESVRCLVTEKVEDEDPWSLMGTGVGWETWEMWLEELEGAIL